MTAESALAFERLHRRLRAETGGAGWGYYSGKGSRIEPTCWALLALGSAWDPSNGAWDAFARPHLAFLAGRQGKDGLLVETEPSLTNLSADGLAALVFTANAELAPPAAVRAFEGLVRVKGVSVDNPDPVQDNRLQGWPWVRDTFSWTEPTAWCLLALKIGARGGHRPPGSGDRIAEAERLLINRSCRTGGWNYGNASALGQELRAYVPTTALGLLAMQDRREEAVVKRALSYLEEARTRERTTTALALVYMCLRLYGRDTADLEPHLREAVNVSERLGNLQAMAMAVYALGADRHSMEALRVRT